MPPSNELAAVPAPTEGLAGALPGAGLGGTDVPMHPPFHRRAPCRRSLSQRNGPSLAQTSQNASVRLPATVATLPWVPILVY